MAFYVQRQFVISFGVTKNVNRVFNQAIWPAWEVSRMICIR